MIIINLFSDKREMQYLSDFNYFKAMLLSINIS